MFDTALLQSIFWSFGRDDTMNDTSMIDPGNTISFLDPCSYFSEVSREEFMKLLSVADRDFLEENSFGSEHREKKF
ncbi:MAG: hypothetical protein ACD_78C00126G0002 [uncultured bacterium (gcode 4)]|uniref:Uncharacterized protein n=1 Tax=uncultured bacterium (gcode 4) TaxID=1234023 RepID=K1YXU6_9BACT|nr:MAG: hypothetical protein ACD_78C00126G0002 [uncultured bacterium (gcode 4)]